MRDRVFPFIRRCLTLVLSFILAAFLAACGTVPQVRAQARLFLPLSLEFLGEYQLSDTQFRDTVVGGLSAITYDRQTGRFYALSDDRSQRAPARFYTLKLQLDRDEGETSRSPKVEIEDVTFLHPAAGETYAPGSLDPEGLAASPRGTVFVSSEGVPSLGIDPAIAEFDLATGQLKDTLRLPQRYLLPNPDEPDTAPRGVQENLGFEALTLSTPSIAPQDPFRLFAATESSLVQDREEPTTEQGPRVRLLHYVINPVGLPALVSETLYVLDPAPTGSLSNGLTELVALEREGFWLSLERTYGFVGAGAKIFQVAGGDATDISRVATLKGASDVLHPLRKQLLFDLSELGIRLDNLEGMALGPRLPDGGQMLMLVSDDNFNEEQITQFLLFRLVEGSRSIQTDSLSLKIKN
ncbi:MAG: esterase-like activity of phytase family protein [Cyanobacteriota bacterium]|nr:esterase-like activity of phytase family protein [Cyanobacteriota bacterium]